MIKHVETGRIIIIFSRYKTVPHQKPDYEFPVDVLVWIKEFLRAVVLKIVIVHFIR